MAQVFISFIHEEHEVAESVQRLLEKRLDGEKVFLSVDQWQVYAGEVWLDRIREELAEAKVVILLLSKRSVNRPWVILRQAPHGLPERSLSRYAMAAFRRTHCQNPTPESKP